MCLSVDEDGLMRENLMVWKKKREKHRIEVLEVQEEGIQCESRESNLR